MAVLGPPAHIVYIGRGKQGKVQQCQHRRDSTHHIAGENSAHDLNGKEHPIDNGQPLDFDGNDKKQQHRHIRKQHGKGQEHGQIHIPCPRQSQIVVAADKAGKNDAHHCQRCTAQIV